MNTVISKLLVYIYNGYNQDVYYDISVYILSHLDLIKDMTLTAFSAACHTSVSTVKKFCRILGYRDFNVFKRYLYTTMKVRKDQIRERYSVYDYEHAIKEMEFISNQKIDQQILTGKIDKIVTDLHEAHVIFILGANYPLFLCFNFIEDMLVFGKQCFIQNVDNNMNSYFNEKNTYCLLITLTGRYFMLNKAKSQNLADSYAHYGVISQNEDILNDLPAVNTFLHLPGKKDTESSNVILLYLLMIIKFAYYEKYAINN